MKWTYFLYQVSNKSLYSTKNNEQKNPTKTDYIYTNLNSN